MLGWIIWFGVLIFDLLLLLQWRIRRRDFLGGERFTMGEIVTLIAAPKIVMLEGAVLIILLLTDISKLHLLWACPAIGFGLTWIESKRTTDIMKKASPPPSSTELGVRASYLASEREAICIECGSELTLEEEELICGSFVCPVCGRNQEFG